MCVHVEVLPGGEPTWAAAAAGGPSSVSVTQDDRQSHFVRQVMSVISKLFHSLVDFI